MLQKSDLEPVLSISLLFFHLQCPDAIMASRLLHRLKCSLFKDGEGAGPDQEEAEFKEDRWEAELEEEEECVTNRLGGKLCFDSDQGGGVEDDGEGSGLDSDSDCLGESMEEGHSSTGEDVSRYV